MSGLREIPTYAGAIAHRSFRVAMDTLYPPLCTLCRARLSEPHSLCAKCWSAISFIEDPVCARCGMPFDVDPGGETLCGPCHAKPHDFDRARALFRYDDASKPLILSFKHGDRLDQAPAFTRWLDRAGKGLLAETDLIIPVPLHRSRLWKRRYNQAALLSGRLSFLAARSHDPMALERRRPTPSQGEMPSAKARRKNVLSAFRVPPAKLEHVRGKRILLVDDVFTTGATLDACARALKRAGASGVDALTLARVVRTAISDI